MHQRYTITAALPYTNGPIHIGHLAGVYIPADIYSRYLRLIGKDVAFICGSDEHGVAISMRAKKEGTTPQAIIDKYHALIKQSFKDFGISFDNYSRTSNEIHHKTASEFFKNLYNNGKFIEETTGQLYDPEAQQFLADRFVTGTCPKCNHEEAYGDQCENCGSSLNATDLINPKSTITGSIPILKETNHWFLPLNQYNDFLKQWILEGHKTDWKPNVYGQCKSWIDEGLKPRAVTRDLDWGIDVPIQGGEGKKLYVWFDAPIGYISSTKEWAEREGKNWAPYWKDKNTKLVHFIGKDNIVFHCIIFPAMLKAEGSYILPDNIPANEFLNLEGQKISTSKNWAVWLHEYLQEFPNKQDVLRYMLTANAPESKDNNFTWKDFQSRNNNELAAIFGNFVNRVMVLTHKYFKGIVPEPNTYTSSDIKALDELKSYPKTISNALENYRFREGLSEMMNIARLGNKYLAEEEPWKIIKENASRVQTQLYIAIQISTALSILCEPFLPFTSSRLKKMLNFSTDSNNNLWETLANNTELLPSGCKIEQSEILFTPIEDADIDFQLEKLKATKALNDIEQKEIAPQKDIISFDQFSKLDFRTGTIIEAQKMPKTKKLLVLKVDIGIGVRTIVSGIAEYFSPDQIIGNKVMVLVNLAPRTLRGIESEGMILMAKTPSGELHFVSLENKEIDNGMSIS